MKRFSTILWTILFPICIYPQSGTEIRKAIKACNYETVIRQIEPISGDTIMTPLRAQSLEAMNRHPEAIKEWNSLLKNDSSNVNILMELAGCYKAITKNQQTMLCYQKATELYPENNFFRQQYIRSLLTNEDYEKACDECKLWIECDSTSAIAYQLLGMACEGISPDFPDMLKDACQAYRRAYRLDSLNGQTIARLAAIYNGLEQYKDAVEITENYRQTDTTDIHVNRQNAKTYCMLKEYDKSIERHEALKSMNDKSFTTYYYLGISYLLGKKDDWEAHDNLLLAHNKRPLDINTLYHLSKASLQSSWKEDGLEYIKRAIEIVTPDDSTMIRLYERLVECSLRVRKDDPYERIENMKKLYALNKDYTLFYNIGYIYERETKDEANAFHYYKKYMDMITKNGKLLVDNNGNRTNKGEGLTREARIQEDIVRFFIKMREKEFFEKGVPNK